MIFSNSLKNISKIGIGDIIANGISAIFWFYLAALIGTDGYGELSYLLAIVGIISAVAFLMRLIKCVALY
mgnify:CR=1 FL=1